MRAIAIDDNRWLYYEGTHSRFGHAIWPMPAVSIATVLRSDVNIATKLPASDFINEAPMIFREDSFDPITRVRRGRLYKAPDSRPEDWRVQPHPAYPEDLIEASAQTSRGGLQRRLYAF